MQNSIQWQEIKSRSLETLKILPNFLKNPIEGMRNLPDWDWINIILLQLIMAAACGFLSGIAAKSVLGALWGAFITPLANLVGNFFLTVLFYYIFLFLYKTQLSLHKLFLNICFASLPFLILRIATPLVPFVDPIGYLIMFYLISVGLTHNFQIPQQVVKKLSIGFMLAYCLFWATTNWYKVQNDFAEKKFAEPQSLDILQKELESH